MRLKLILLALIFTLAYPANSQDVDHWETAVYDSLVWKYFPGTSAPPADWSTFGFDDTAWASGKGGFGYDDNDDRTIIPPVISVFIRTKFSITDLSKIEQAVLHMDFDDGFVAYINGVEIARSFMTATAFDQPSAGIHEARLYQGLAPEGFIIRKATLASILTPGENVLAIQVHNQSATSSDMSAAAFLTFGINDGSSFFGPTPSWFENPNLFTSTNLPIIIINTNNQQIQDEVRITADMEVIYNGPGMVNHISDQPNNYDGKISVEYRGESSQSFPKKSMSIETQNSIGENVNVSLVDLPKENDWVLYAPYSDKTLLRNVLAYKIGRDLGSYAPRTRFVEVVLNDEYVGVYVLIEKIKVDKNRVDIDKLDADDISGDDLTGGYILRKDKIDDNDYPEWGTTSGLWGTFYQYFDPKGEDLLDVQRDYIREFMNDFELALFSDNYRDPAIGYQKYIDVPSFINFSLVNELSKNVDGYQFSTYMYKERDSDGGKLHMGPLWDFNLAFGNVDYSQSSMITTGWLWEERLPWWSSRLVLDPFYTADMKCRWLNLRSGKLKNDQVVHYLDSMVLVLDEAQQRNFDRWPVQGQYVWPNQFVGVTYAEDVSFLKQWLLDRLVWMDNNMPGECDQISAVSPHGELKTSVHPNPSATTFTVEFANAEHESVVKIYNAVGEIVLSTETRGSSFEWNSINEKGTEVAPGLYVINIYDGSKLIAVHRVVKI